MYVFVSGPDVTQGLLPVLICQADDPCPLIFPRMQLFKGLFPLRNDITDLAKIDTSQSPVRHVEAFAFISCSVRRWKQKMYCRLTDFNVLDGTVSVTKMKIK